MRRITMMMFMALAILTNAMAQTTFSVTVTNPTKSERQNAPVVCPVDGLTRSALVTYKGQEIPCQLDDINGDGLFDELCFLTNIGKKEKQTFNITLEESGSPRQYPSQVYVEMMLTN